jgi:3-dehydroquinate dehydratase-1
MFRVKILKPVRPIVIGCGNPIIYYPMEMFIRDYKVGDFPLVSGALTDTDYQLVDNDVLNTVDIIELRVDMFSAFDHAHVKNVFKEVRDAFNKPIIATVRDIREGGANEIPARLEMYRSVTPLSDAVDVEINADDIFPDIKKLCGLFKKILIGSHHNFDETPGLQELEAIVEKGYSAGADIVKIAVKANSRDDMMTIMSLAMNHRDGRLITISMGDKGLASRIVTPVIGSPITYGYIHTPSAPGQFSAAELMSVFRKLRIR